MPVNPAAGRKRKPTHLHVVKGTPQTKLKDRKNEPKPARKIPPMPSDISDKAKTVWPRLSQKLDRMGVLTVADELALERMCETYADILECEQDIRDNGYTYWSDGETRLLKANPAVAAKRAFEALFKAYLVEFGLTPSSRARVNGDGGEGGDEGDGDGLID